MMALAQKKSIHPVAAERRRFQRVKVHLLGRYMLPDRREFPCQVINMSPGGLAMLAPGIGDVGDRVIAYLDHIGRVEGKITRIIDNGFAMSVGAGRTTDPARQPRHPQSSGRSSPRPYHPAKSDRHPHSRGRSADDLPDHRFVSVRCGRRGGASAAAQVAGFAWPSSGTSRPTPRRRLRARVHSRTARRDSRRQRHRQVNAWAQLPLAFLVCKPLPARSA